MGVLANHHSSLQCITSVANFTYWWRTSICSRFPHRMTQPETDRFWRTMSVRESPRWNEAAEAESRVGSRSLALAQAMTSMQRDAAESEVSRRATRRPTRESAFRSGNKCITGLGSLSHTHARARTTTSTQEDPATSTCLLACTHIIIWRLRHISGVGNTVEPLEFENLCIYNLYWFPWENLHISTK